MARIRTIKPEFWSHPVMGKLDDATKCLALALLNFSDDEGYFLADPVLVRSFARPFDEDSTITRRGLAQLEKSDWIEVCEHPSHGRIGRVVNFTSHQNVDRGKPSKIKEYFESSNDRRMIVEESALEQGTGNREQGIKNTAAQQADAGAIGDKTKRASWQKALPSDVVEATRTIKGFWPDPTKGDMQPDGKASVPGVSSSELAARLLEIKNQGADLAICIAIAQRAVREWREGQKWIKAPQHFFGKAKDAPFRAYYQAHVTNQALRDAS